MTHKFEELQPGTIARLSIRSGGPQIDVEFSELKLDGGRPFYVINGAWDGVLYPDLEMLVVHTGSRYKVNILAIKQPKAVIKEKFNDDISF